MTRSSLANQLLGKMIVPKPEFGSPTANKDVNWKLWANLKPNLSGEWIATVDAVWIHEGSVMVAVHDPFGNNAEFFLTQVNLQTDAAQQAYQKQADLSLAKMANAQADTDQGTKEDE